MRADTACWDRRLWRCKRWCNRSVVGRTGAAQRCHEHLDRRRVGRHGPSPVQRRKLGQRGVGEIFVAPAARTADDRRCTCLRELSKQQLHRWQAIRRLLMRFEEVHALSWVWPRHAPCVARAVEGTRRATASTSLTLTLPLVRRRAGARRVLLRSLFRWAMTLAVFVALPGVFVGAAVFCLHFVRWVASYRCLRSLLLWALRCNATAAAVVVCLCYIECCFLPARLGFIHAITLKLLGKSNCCSTLFGRLPVLCVSRRIVA